jgi:hypothetical protein
VVNSSRPLRRKGIGKTQTAASEAVKPSATRSFSIQTRILEVLPLKWEVEAVRNTALNYTELLFI